MGGWALDLGTTNTGLACWDEANGQPQLVELPRICRRPRSDDPLEAPTLVPTVVEVLSATSLLDRLGAWPPLARGGVRGGRGPPHPGPGGHGARRRLRRLPGAARGDPALVGGAAAPLPRRAPRRRPRLWPGAPPRAHRGGGRHRGG